MKTHLRWIIAASAAALLLVASQPASAGAILSPVTATASATVSGDIARTIDQSGLSAGFVSGVTDFATYLAGNPTHASPGPANAWSAAVGNLPIDLDFDLGAAYGIGDLALWTSFGGFSINRFSVFTAADAAFVTGVNVGSFDANDTNPVVAQVFDLAPSVGRYLRVQILSNEGAGFVNLSEAAVEVSPVPEPATLVLVGAGLVAASMRRRFLRRTRA